MLISGTALRICRGIGTYLSLKNNPNSIEAYRNPGDQKLTGERVLRVDSLSKQWNERWKIKNRRVLGDNILQQPVEQLRSVLHRHVCVRNKSRQGGEDFWEHRDYGLSSNFHNVVETFTREISNASIGVEKAIQHWSQEIPNKLAAFGS